MAVSAAILNLAANAVMDFHFQRGKVFDQAIQEKPLLAWLAGKSKVFPGGKEQITVRVVGDYTSSFMGYSYDDTVSYGNPANLKTLVFPWKEIHDGYTMTYTELKQEGVHVVDSLDGKSTSESSDRDQILLAGILDHKNEQLAEGWARGCNDMSWKDGTQDAKQVPGILSFILDDPTTATLVAGIDQSVSTWWQNAYSIGVNAATASNQNLTNALETKWRQVRRYGGKPDKAFAGSDWLDAYVKECRVNGSLSQTGFADKTMDNSNGEAAFKRVPIVYDPTLDDLGRSKYCYFLDGKTIRPMDMDSEGTLTQPKKHFPARPEDKYVLYRGLTWSGGLICTKRNANLVSSIA